MELNLLNPRKSLNSAFRKVKPERRQIEQFKHNLLQLLDSRNDIESEEHHKNLVIDFLKKTYYDPGHFVNTKGRTDLVIHNGDKGTSPVGVIVETKKSNNRQEMIREGKVNAKAFHELLLYYLRERITQKNLDIKYLIVTNINEWFIFDAHLFETLFAQNKKLVKQFEDFETHRLAGNKTDFFYGDVAGPAIDSIDQKVDCTWFDFRDYEKALRNDNPKDDNKLIALYKLLSPQHLLKLPFANDSNSLDRRFYSELLHIIGLSETREGSKKIIRRNDEGQRISGSLLENTIAKLDSLDKINRLEKPSRFGASYQERLFNVGLELVITWINRILFLKLMEAQLVNYHKGDRSYEFLNSDRIHDYDDLEYLFFSVLARPYEQRGEEALRRFEKVPYLNSSLFESAKIEDQTILISNLRDEKKIPILPTTVLKDQGGKKRTGQLETLEYLFAFLNAYDFSSEGGEEIQEENKTLINASVLGLIFEKINGYKDGSFFTPGFITMYMSRETIRRAVVQKFNETKGWDCKTIDDVYDRIEDRDEANKVINSLKICDPAVGSGHFLVSALNEIIAIKHDLRVLQDREGRRLKEYSVEVANDELVITDEDGDLFEYRPGNPERQRVQETLFHEKQTIIENCLFGVDINPNSVKICRLRLWIELLKNAYYIQSQPPTARKDSNSSPLGGGREGAISPLGGGREGAISPQVRGREGALETLPNIDINIKEGNSLISRFDIDADLKQALRKSDGKWTIDSYRSAVATYRNADSKEQKHQMERLIDDIKSNFRSEISLNDPKVKRLRKLKNELSTLTQQGQLFEFGKREKAAWNKKVQKLSADSKKLETEIDEIRNNQIYENAFEWRFEFPEVLDEEGNFVGFDVVIGNPPYVRSREGMSEIEKIYFYSAYSTISYQPDLYKLFIELSTRITGTNSHICLITPSVFLSNDYDKPLRQFLLGNYSVGFASSPSDSVFEEANVSITVFSISRKRSDSLIDILTIKENSFKSKGHVKQSHFEKDGYVVNTEIDPDFFDLIEKIEENSFRLGDKYVVKNGIKIRKNLLSEMKDGDSFKPFSLGRDITFLGKLNISSYIPYSKENELRYTNQAFRSPAVFESRKVVVRQIPARNHIIATIDEEGIYTDQTIYNINLETDSQITLDLLLGIITSKLMFFYFKNTLSDNKNLFPKIKRSQLLQLPISQQRNEKLTGVIKEILGLKKQSPTADTTALESEIDRLVYELYGLTGEEIRIVEESVG